MTDEFSFGLAITTLKCFIMSYLPLFLVFWYSVFWRLSRDGNHKKLASSRFHLIHVYSGSNLVDLKFPTLEVSNMPPKYVH